MLEHQGVNLHKPKYIEVKAADWKL